MKTVALLLLASLPVGALLAGCTTGPDSSPSAELLLGKIDTSGVGSADYDRGKHYLASGDYGLAIDSFEKALAEAPGSADAMNGLAIAYDRIGRKEDAAMFLNKALALDPRSAYTLNNFAYFHLSHGEPDQAMAYFARAKAALAATPKTGAPRTLPTIVANNLATLSRPESATQDVAATTAKQEPVHALDAPPNISALPVAVPVRPAGSLAANAETKPDVSAMLSAAPATQVALAETPRTTPSDNPPAHSGPVMNPPQPSIAAGFSLDHVTVRIANLTGRARMARRFAQYLGGQGMAAHHLINVQYDNRRQSTIYYSRGLEGAAKALAQLVPVPVRILALPNDYRTVELMLAPDLEEFDRALSSSSKTSA
jgi:hypothetical protein